MAKAGLPAVICVLALAGQPVRAQAPNVERPMVDHVEDAVTQPARDVNLKKDKIPQRLLDIQDAPYDLRGMDRCPAIMAEIRSLRPLLGPDVNEDPHLSRAEKRERGISRVAGGLIGGLIPFRGVVREVTGANAAEQRYRKALSAGFARRSFLKGVAHSKGCRTATAALAPPTNLLPQN